MTTSHKNLVAIAALFLASFTGCAVLHPGGGCGCGDTLGCGSEIGCEVGCAVEPSCGCGDSCQLGGRSQAGQQWIGSGNCSGPKFNFCTNCDGGCNDGCNTGNCDAGNYGEASCGCEEPACGCAEPSCGCGDIGCGSTCGSEVCGRGIRSNVRYGVGCIVGEVGQIFSPVCALFGLNQCGGCDSELYWNEWHNDPPCCNDPCDKCGNWIGSGH